MMSLDTVAGHPRTSICSPNRWIHRSTSGYLTVTSVIGPYCVCSGILAFMPALAERIIRPCSRGFLRH